MAVRRNVECCFSSLQMHANAMQIDHCLEFMVIIQSFLGAWEGDFTVSYLYVIYEHPCPYIFSCNMHLTARGVCVLGGFYCKMDFNLSCITAYGLGWHFSLCTLCVDLSKICSSG